MHLPHGVRDVRAHDVLLQPEVCHDLGLGDELIDPVQVLISPLQMQIQLPVLDPVPALDVHAEGNPVQDVAVVVAQARLMVQALVVVVLVVLLLGLEVVFVGVQLVVGLGVVDDGEAVLFQSVGV